MAERDLVAPQPHPCRRDQAPAAEAGRRSRVQREAVVPPQRAVRARVGHAALVALLVGTDAFVVGLSAVMRSKFLGCFDSTTP